MRLEIRLDEREVRTPSGPVPFNQRTGERWVTLYACVAYRRKVPALGGPAATREELIQLPGWSRTSPEGLGVQVQREMKRLRALGLPEVIVSQGGETVGPYLLAPTYTDIVFEPASDEEVRMRLGIASFGARRPPDLSRLAAFADGMFIGTAELARGNLGAARDAFAVASDAAETHQQRAQAATRLARAYEHLGDDDAARATILALRGRLHSARSDLVAQAILLCQEGWMAWRRKTRESLQKAERDVREALGLLRDDFTYPAVAGRLYNLLGLIAAERRDDEIAAAYFSYALEIWTLSGDPYSAQSVYFNMGQLVREQGDDFLRRFIRRGLPSWHATSTQSREGDARATEERLTQSRGAPGPLPPGARALYERAMSWIEHAESFCTRVGIGGDALLDLIELARLRARLGSVDRAREDAAIAVNHARNAAERERALRTVQAVEDYVRSRFDYRVLLRESGNLELPRLARGRRGPR